MTRIHTQTRTARRFGSLRYGIVGLTLAALLGLARPALAGPPLLCHAFDIGTSTSLPWNTQPRANWYDGQPDYDLQRLVDETEALLTPAAPIVLRMETLRRAAIYASRDEAVVKRLWLTINDRVRATSQGGKADALAAFDAGYLAETLKEISRLDKYGFKGFSAKGAAIRALVQEVDGYAMVQKSLAMRAGDPAIEFASALIAASDEKTRGLYGAHAQKARAGATKDALLARNLDHISN